MGKVLSIRWIGYARQGHLGLVGMKERAEAVGGALQLISKLGEGTLVQAIVPLPDNYYQKDSEIQIS
jgi:nitrate/nitrite-specific signal transduction histidine kinase